MLKFIILLGALTTGAFCVNFTQYFQNDYIMTSERFEVVESNEDYVTDVVFKNFKYNRTNFAVNASGTWKVDVHGALTALIQGYRFASNEYRLFPFIMPLDVCDVLKRNIFGLQSMYNCGHMFRCPIKKGHYSTCNWAPDGTKFPPHGPRGQFRFNFELQTSGITILKFNWYVELKDVPLPY